MDTMAKCVDTSVAGVSLVVSESMFDLRVNGFPEPVGFVDENRSVVYLPTDDYMTAMLNKADMNQHERENVFDAYQRIGDVLVEQGYRRCLVTDG